MPFYSEDRTEDFSPHWPSLYEKLGKLSPLFTTVTAGTIRGLATCLATERVAMALKTQLISTMSPIELEILVTELGLTRDSFTATDSQVLVEVAAPSGTLSFRYRDQQDSAFP